MSARDPYESNTERLAGGILTFLRGLFLVFLVVFGTLAALVIGLRLMH